MQRALIAFAATALTLESAAFAQSEIPIDEVPAAIVAKAETTIPGVTFHRVSTELEDGVLIYEFEAFNSAGQHVEVDITERGAIQEIEMEISLAQAPRAVRAALEEVAAGFEPDHVQYSVRDGGRDYVYEFEGEHNARPLEVEIAENGRVLFVSDGSVG